MLSKCDPGLNHVLPKTTREAHEVLVDGGVGELFVRHE